MRVYKKYKKCGDIVAVHQYEKGFLLGYKKTVGLAMEYDEETKKKKYYKIDKKTGELTEVKVGRQNVARSEEEQKRIRKRNLFKAKNTIKDLINTNAYAYIDNKKNTIRPKFLTLTFKDNITDLKVANTEFKNFIKRLNYYIKKNIDKDFIGVQYVTVVEFQERGAVHYHSLMFNLPWIKWNVILDKWGLGGAYIEGFKSKDNKVVKIDYDNEKKCFKANGSSIHNVGAYITKTMEYMSKSLDDDRLKGQKCYFSSRRLKKPIVVNDIAKNKNQIEQLVATLSERNLVFSNTYFNDHIGMCHYQEYNTKFTGISSRTVMEDFTDMCVREAWGTDNKLFEEK